MRALATLTLTFGLVSIPVKLYSATERSTAIRFRMMSARGGRMKQQYVEEPQHAHDEAWPAQEDDVEEATSPPATAGKAVAVRQRTVADDAEPPVQWQGIEPARTAVVERNEMSKGYEFEKGKFVLFSPAELKALREAARESIDIVSFVPLGAVDPIYFDKAYLLAPDKRGERPYALLLAALQHSGRCALAKWAWRSKQYVVQVRPAEGGLVLQQLRYADEVRSVKDLDIPLAQVADAELQLALRLVEQASQPAYDPTQFVDEEKLRILAAVERKIAGREVIDSQPEPAVATGEVIDLMEALRASLRRISPSSAASPRSSVAAASAPGSAGSRGARRGVSRPPGTSRRRSGSG
jgi:DNA end-binding protein Ku